MPRLFVVSMPSGPLDEEYFVEYFVAGKLIFIHKERRSIIPKQGEPIVTIGGVNLRVLKVQCQPEFSRATVDCEWVA
jgi:hypothetical protein